MHHSQSLSLDPPMLVCHISHFLSTVLLLHALQRRLLVCCPRLQPCDLNPTLLDSCQQRTVFDWAVVRPSVLSVLQFTL